MDIYAFLNSPDVADYLRNEGYEFSAAKAAYIVYLSDTASFDEKIAAWQEIVDTMPDCPLSPSAEAPYSKKSHGGELQFLQDYIFVQQLKQKRFMDARGCVYIPKEVRYVLDTALRYGKDEHTLWTEDNPLAYSSFDKCVDSLRRDDEDAPEFDRCRIAKCRIDAGTASGDGRVYAVLDDRLRVLDIGLADFDPRYEAVDYHFAFSFVELPIPFKRGDIVIDRTARDPRPFVFDHLKFWDSSELTAHGHVLSENLAQKIDASIESWRKHGSKDDSYMTALGWALGEGSMTGVWDSCLLAYNPFGACDNYLNLEYYREPLEDELRLLDVASKWARGELSIDLAIDTAVLISAEVRAKKLRRQMEGEYTVVP